MTKISIRDTPTLFDRVTAAGLDAPPPLLPATTFDGKTYDPAHDHDRLKKQLGRVWHWTINGGWSTLAELAQLTGAPEASVSARLRDLRKPKFGGYIIDRRRRGLASNGLWEYRMRRKPDKGL